MPRVLLMLVFVFAAAGSSACAVRSHARSAARDVQSAAFWCPMHPDVRGNAGEKCPVCGMALVRVVTAGYDAYALDVEIAPRALEPKKRGHARLYVREPITGATVRRFERVHERDFHLFILSHDLEYFAHVHPALAADGSLGVAIEVPQAGAYRLIADFVPEGAPPQFLQKSFATAGYTGLVGGRAKLAADLGDKVIGRTRIKAVIPPARAGREQLVTFELVDEGTGVPVPDLEPYLGAAGHMLMVSDDLEIAAHSHPVPELAIHRASVVFQVLFPRAGAYRLWAQFQRAGEVLTAAFTVPVAESY